MIEINKVVEKEQIKVGDLVREISTGNIGIVIKQDSQRETASNYNVLLLDTVNEEHHLAYFNLHNYLCTIEKDFTVVKRKGNYKLSIEY